MRISGMRLRSASKATIIAGNTVLHSTPSTSPVAATAVVSDNDGAANEAPIVNALPAAAVIIDAVGGGGSRGSRGGDRGSDDDEEDEDDAELAAAPGSAVHGVAGLIACFASLTNCCRS